VAATDRNGVSLLCSCRAFSATACAALQALSDGDSVAVCGEASVTTWDGKDGTQRHGLDVLVHGVLTAYHLGRKRKASEPATGGDNERGPL
jgi:single-stranded DNA-binding protein